MQSDRQRQDSGASPRVATTRRLSVSLNCKFRNTPVGDEHAARRMGNGKIRPRLQNDRLRCHAARPKYRDFVGPNGHRIAVVRLRDVADADLSRSAKVHRRAVQCGKSSGDLRRSTRRVDASVQSGRRNSCNPGRRPSRHARTKTNSRSRRRRGRRANAPRLPAGLWLLMERMACGHRHRYITLSPFVTSSRVATGSFGLPRADSARFQA